MTSFWALLSPKSTATAVFIVLGSLGASGAATTLMALVTESQATCSCTSAATFVSAEAALMSGNPKSQAKNSPK